MLNDVDMMLMLHEIHRKDRHQDLHWKQVADPRERWDLSDGYLRRALKAVRSLFTTPAVEKKSEPVRLTVVSNAKSPAARLRIVRENQENPAT